MSYSEWQSYTYSKIIHYYVSCRLFKHIMSKCHLYHILLKLKCSTYVMFFVTGQRSQSLHLMSLDHRSKRTDKAVTRALNSAKQTSFEINLESS